ncbi:hypothetical protein RvY_02745-1 [Ramazzottius varieornatus]|uniref:Uncharacterized protein n=1 Tax=Ramazzottius varieornatus TaxID=947166 RepID=A0A1D1URJ7_RAMVA|nr:hypothetical protein RvY_02745-1 [Ramazzottius varieornatus]
MDIFVDKDAMTSLQSLAVLQLSLPVPAYVQKLIQSVAYAWMLLEHLLGGKEAVSRSFTYASSGACPIARKELVEVVFNLCDAVLEHMEWTLTLTNKEEVRTEVLSMLKPIASVPFKDAGLSRGEARCPSDEFIHDRLKDNSYPDDGKIQIAHGYDFYLGEGKLDDIEQFHKEAGAKSTVMQRWCRFTVDIVAELVGGTKALDRRQEETGDDI